MPLSLSSQLSRRVSLRAGHRRAVGRARGSALAQRRKVWEMEAYYIAQALVDYICILAPEKDHSGRRRDAAAAAFSADPQRSAPHDGRLSGGGGTERPGYYIVPESLNGDQGILGSLCLGAAEWAREHGGREA